MEVKDIFRMVVCAIDYGDLYCGSLTREKDPYWPQSSLKRNQEVIEACIDGERYDRKFLKGHDILRWEFAEWCDRKGIPFPEFWFPPGWTTDEPGYPLSLGKATESKAPPSGDANIPPAAPEPGKKPRNNDGIWLDVQIAAKIIWAETGPIPVAQVARRIKTMKQFSGTRFMPESIRKRIAHLAPPEIRGKPGRPRGKKSS